MAYYPITPDVDIDLLQAMLWKLIGVQDGIVYQNGRYSPPTDIEYITPLTADQQTLFNQLVEIASARARFNALPDWATYTAPEAEAAVTNAIFNGQTQAQVEQAITAAITAAPNTVAGVKTVMNTLFIQAADQVIAIRGILIIFGKILVWLRNIVLNKL